jgi:hypothetical protein
MKSMCLLSKCLFNLLNEEGMWHVHLHNKYLITKSLSQVQAKPTDSLFWKGIIRGKDEFLSKAHLFLAMARLLDFGRMLGWEKYH